LLLYLTDCGRTLEDDRLYAMVVGGTDAYPGDNPWHVTLVTTFVWNLFTLPTNE